MFIDQNDINTPHEKQLITAEMSHIKSFQYFINNSEIGGVEIS